MSRKGKIQVIARMRSAAKVLNVLGELTDLRIQVGVFGSEANDIVPDSDGLTYGELALIHEYGTDHVPKRSFLRRTFIKKRSYLLGLYATGVRDVVERGQNVRRVLNRIGKEAVRLVHDQIEYQDVPPPNADGTIRHKGFDHALLETGGLVARIKHKVVTSDKVTGRVEVPGAEGE